MRHQIQTLRLRFWAFCQFLYDLLTQPTLSDRGISFREEFVRTCLLGRVNQLRFVGLEDDFPELKGKRLFATSHLRRVARATRGSASDFGASTCGVKKPRQDPQHIKISEPGGS